MDRTPSACIANIGARGRRKRLAVGIAGFVVGGALAILLVMSTAALAWRLALFLPFYVGALGFFQWRDKT
jgi:hypothetical protein